MAGADTLTPVLDGLTFPEAPRWHDGRLWLSDFYSERLGLEPSSVAALSN